METQKEQLYIEKIKSLEELVDLYSKDYRKQGLKYPDDYNTTQGRKVIKLKDKIASLTEQINQTENEEQFMKDELFKKVYIKSEKDLLKQKTTPDDSDISEEAEIFAIIENHWTKYDYPFANQKAMTDEILMWHKSKFNPLPDVRQIIDDEIEGEFPTTEEDYFWFDTPQEGERWLRSKMEKK